MAKKPEPILLWCQQLDCQTGYASTGERPKVCPACGKFPDWTRTPPYKIHENDRRFLKSLRIAQD